MSDLERLILDAMKLVIALAFIFILLWAGYDFRGFLVRKDCELNARTFYGSKEIVCTVNP